jgi:hypothetical protein
MATKQTFTLKDGALRVTSTYFANSLAYTLRGNVICDIQDIQNRQPAVVLEAIGRSVGTLWTFNNQGTITTGSPRLNDIFVRDNVLCFQSLATIQRNCSPTALEKALCNETIGFFDPYLHLGHKPCCPYCGGQSISDGVALGERCVKGVGGGDMDMLVMTRPHKCKTGEHALCIGAGLLI